MKSPPTIARNGAAGLGLRRGFGVRGGFGVGCGFGVRSDSSVQRTFSTAAAMMACACLVTPALAQETPAQDDSLATESLPLEPTREIRFTTSEGSWMSVDISPDGTTLVFDLLGDLYTLPAGGGTATPLMTGPAFESQPRFSPDGSEIVFVSDRSGGQNLWVISADGSDTTQRRSRSTN